jgi:hypothetical protein
VKPELDQLTSVFIPAARSISDVWFQRFDSGDTLEHIAAALAAATGPAARPFTPGELCVVSHEDGAHYRAEVRSHEGGKYQLFLFDHGDLYEAGEKDVFRLVDDELAKIPRQAFRGRITGVEDKLEFYEEVTEDMIEKHAGEVLVSLGFEEPVDVIFKDEGGEFWSPLTI